MFFEVCGVAWLFWNFKQAVRELWSGWNKFPALIKKKIVAINFSKTILLKSKASHFQNTSSYSCFKQIPPPVRVALDCDSVSVGEEGRDKQTH